LARFDSVCFHFENSLFGSVLFIRHDLDRKIGSVRSERMALVAGPTGLLRKNILCFNAL
jgi:hypothetical protein